MVVGVGAAVATVLTGGVATAPVIFGLGAGTTAGTVGTSAAVGTATAIGTAGGAILGAEAAGTAVGAAVGALAGGTSAAGVGGSGAAAGALIAGTGGMGLLVIGTNVNSEDDKITYDCWKPVLHDKSTESSSGMLLRDLVCHPNVAKVTMTTSICTEFPNIVIENIWQEKFEIQYLLIHSTGKLAGHAKSF